MIERDWYWYDFLLISGDAYVDHPSFGTAVIGRVLEAEGFRVAVLAQPDWRSTEPFLAFGKPRLGILIGAGNLDSMVAHYTASKKRRSEDFYSPGKRVGLRPDRATIVYAKKAREAFGPDIPILIGGLEASLRRFAHYDYWGNDVRPSILIDSPSDLLLYGMGERAIREVARRLKGGAAVSELRGIPGTAYITDNSTDCPSGTVACVSFEEIKASKAAYAAATKLQYEEHDPVRGHAVIQRHGDRYLVVVKPAMPLSRLELDQVSDLPYTRRAHPMYDETGGVPALDEVKFSIIHNRGCFGACNFCSLAWHQGRMVTSRSQESVLREAEAMTKDPDFKGYIHDVGGPTANFRHFSCKDQEKKGVCKNRKCLTPTPCPRLDADSTDYLSLLRRLRKVKGVKKVFIRSGIRYDYLLKDEKRDLAEEIIAYHISGQIKVAPEHCVDAVLDAMGKPHIDVYRRFIELYSQINGKNGKNQFVVPYLMSSHPGSTLSDAVALALFLHQSGRQPEQVQDFYPTPGTISTCMYYTGLDPMTGKRIYVARTPHEKDLQRALLQWRNPENRSLVVEALRKADRPDLIGHDPKCLIRPPTKEQREAAEFGHSRAGVSSRKSGGHSSRSAVTHANRDRREDLRPQKRGTQSSHTAKTTANKKKKG